jgi:uncharacterized protein YqgC (DUF456 family)
MFYGIGLVLGAILVLLGFVGSVLPALPGLPLTFLGLLLFAFVRHFQPPLSPTLLMMMLIVTIVVSVADHFVPFLGAKKYGASRWGIYGSIGGMVLGAFFSPLGMLLGAFIGAVFVEWMVSRKKGHALRAGWGIFVGTILGMALKLGAAGIMAYYFLLAAIS